MTLPQKGSRTLVVDDIAYRWRIRKKPTYSQAAQESGLIVAIEQTTGGARLVVKLTSCRPDNWIGADSVTITPKDDARYIQHALVSGWSAGQPGPAFELAGDDVA